MEGPADRVGDISGCTDESIVTQRMAGNPHVKDEYKGSVDLTFHLSKRRVETYLDELRESWQCFLERDYSKLLLDREGNSIGYCPAERAEEGETIIQDLAVRKNMQGSGLGKVLLSEVLSCLKEKGYHRAILTVTEGNKAIGLYDKMSFRFYPTYPEIVQE